VERFVSVTPWNGAPFATWGPLDAAGVDAALQAGAAAAADWAAVPVAARAAALDGLAAALRAAAPVLAAQIVAEVGKPIGEAVAEVEKCALVCAWYAAEGPALLAPVALRGGPRAVTLRRDPAGLVLSIMPWNFPFWQVFRVLAPAVLAGDALRVKHAPSTQGCMAALAAVAARALPPGLVDGLRAPLPLLPAALAHPAVARVTFTGSTPAGRAVAAQAGAALKRTVLELGGSDAFVVLADADPAAAARAAAASRCINAGQSCIAAKRFVVEAAVAPAFTEALHAALAAFVPGDPRDPATRLGPLHRADLRATLHAQVQASRAAGARLLLGGEVPEGPGFFYPPTLLLGPPDGCPAADDELFGPVASVFVVPDAEAAIARANRSPYALAASVWSGDPARAAALAPRLRAGSLFVNAAPASEPGVPFGGRGDSGHGRELGAAGLDELVELRALTVVS
jgi:succinate-semialdehyde dehydrogenase/glutarate-semialdehyde dehydrogenase